MCFELCWLPGSIPPEGMEILSGGGGAGGEGELRENSKSSGSRCGGLSAAMGGGICGICDGARMPTADWVPLPTP